MTWNAITATGNIRLEKENLIERSFICNSDWMIIAAGWRYVCVWNYGYTVYPKRTEKINGMSLKVEFYFSKSNLGFNKLHFRYFLHWFCISWRERNFLKKEAPEGTMFNKLKKSSNCDDLWSSWRALFSCFSESVGWKPVRLPGDDARPRPAQSNIAFFNCPIFILSVQYEI